MEVFKDYAYYYNAFYHDKDYRAEVLQVDNLLKKYGQNISRIINYGCGTGRHDLALSELGYHCTGIDMSPLMIEIARKNAENSRYDIEFSVADIRNYRPQSKYDAVVSLFHVISYQNRNQDVMEAFHAARCALGQGGIFLFDVWYGPGVLSDRPVLRVKEAEDEKNRLVRIARPVMHDKKNIVDVCYEVFVIDKVTGNTETINEVHNMRYFFKPELELFLQETGFELIDNLDCQTLGETNYDSWTSYFIARAI
ncbi:MAG: class I SAM-dependent methyltransferase [Lachnospiraceae bacterium]|nr:class I SAM-dependent methyltransferase [Lachnospiraceae bacterium]